MASWFEWLLFVGAWLLFAGPVYQAALELDEEEVEREALVAAASAVGRPAPVSPWWWLVPPVGYLLARRRARAYRDSVFAELTPAVRRQLVSYTDKASGWLIVAAGGLLIAVADTGRLAESLHWSLGVTAVVAVLAALLSGSYTAGRMRRRRRLLEDRRRPRPSAPPPTAG